LYVGDFNGNIHTIDLLKEKTISVIDNHIGKVKLGEIHDNFGKRKFIVSSGYDNTIFIYETTKLEPNYRRIISEVSQIKVNNFIQKGLDESAVDYDKRVTDINLKKFTNETVSLLVDSIAKTKTSRPLTFKIEKDSLEVSQDPFPKVKIKLSKPVIDVSSISASEIHYSLEKDNTFSISDLILIQPNGTIKYSSDKRKMLQYEEEISLEMAKEIAEGKGILVRRENAEELLAIRRGEVDLQSLIDRAENDIVEIDRLFKESDLPESVDLGFINDLLVSVRKEFYGLE
jgi:WD40 repeat protein